MGETLETLRSVGLLDQEKIFSHTAVKEAVLPFNRFPNTDAVLGPEMRSTGEVMGIDATPWIGICEEPARCWNVFAKRRNCIHLSGGP